LIVFQKFKLPFEQQVIFNSWIESLFHQVAGARETSATFEGPAMRKGHFSGGASESPSLTI
jgi:hypothetical protein